MVFKRNKKTGFVILYAVIVASVVSLSGILLGNIIVKQIILSSIGRESQFAYYEANSVDECIENAVNRAQFGFFLSGLEGGQADFFEEANPSFLCNVQNFDTNPPGEVGGDKVFDLIVGECTDVRVILKEPDQLGDSAVLLRTKGYNICEVDHSRRVEKVIYRDYNNGGDL